MILNGKPLNFGAINSYSIALTTAICIATLGNATAVADGVGVVSADFSVSQGQNTGALDGSVSVLSGSTISQDANTIASAASVLVIADLSASQAAVTVDANASIDGVTANCSVTIADAAAIAAGSVVVSATLTATQGQSPGVLGYSGRGGISRSGINSFPLNGIAFSNIQYLASDATVLVASASTIAQAPHTSLSDSSVLVGAVLSASQGAVTATSDSSVLVSSGATLTQAGQTAVADGVLTILGNFVQGQSPQTTSSAGGVSIVGASNTTTSNNSGVISAFVLVGANLTRTLQDEWLIVEFRYSLIRHVSGSSVTGHVVSQPLTRHPVGAALDGHTAFNELTRHSGGEPIQVH
jgi:hypothetical protein